YAGNRAPLHIGHHFMNYGGGAYNEALKSFARAVCGLPEVRCVTYAKLADFMDQQNAETLAAYRKGDFPRAATPALNFAALSRKPCLSPSPRPLPTQRPLHYQLAPIPLRLWLPPSPALRVCA